MRANFLRAFSALLVLVLLTFGLQSCGGSGGGGSSSGGGGSKVKTTPITSATQAKSVASQVYYIGTDLIEGDDEFIPNSSRSLATSNKTYKNLSAISKMVSKAVNITHTAPFDTINTRSSSFVEVDNCTYSGTITYSGSYDSSTNYIDYKIQSNNCSDDNEYIDNGIYYTKGHYYADDNFDVTITSSNYTDNAIDGSDNSTLKDISFELKSKDNSLTLTATNGSYNESRIYGGVNNSLSLTFNNLTVTDTVTDIGENYTIDGIITYNLTPPDACEGLNGTYEYKTIEPVEYDEASDLDISGDIKINDNAEIKWNSDGTINIYYSNQSVYQGSEDSLENICPAIASTYE